jgi:hypothetical protein
MKLNLSLFALAYGADRSADRQIPNQHPVQRMWRWGDYCGDWVENFALDNSGDGYQRDGVGYKGKWAWQFETRCKKAVSRFVDNFKREGTYNGKTRTYGVRKFCGFYNGQAPHGTFLNGNEVNIHWKGWQGKEDGIYSPLPSQEHNQWKPATGHHAEDGVIEEFGHHDGLNPDGTVIDPTYNELHNYHEYATGVPTGDFKNPSRKRRSNEVATADQELDEVFNFLDAYFSKDIQRGDRYNLKNPCHGFREIMQGFHKWGRRYLGLCRAQGEYKYISRHVTKWMLSVMKGYDCDVQKELFPGQIKMATKINNEPNKNGNKNFVGESKLDLSKLSLKWLPGKKPIKLQNQQNKNKNKNNGRK